MGKSAKEVLEWGKKEGVEFADIRFTDPLGLTHHFTMPWHAIDDEAFSFGIGIDGSSVRGWKTINESDMLARLDPDTAFIDPFFQHKTAAFLCDIYEPSGEAYARDPRQILKKAIQHMKDSGIADTMYTGPEAEFFIFSDVRYHHGTNSGFYSVDSPNAEWNMGAEEEGGNLGHKMRVKGGYFPTPPNDPFQDMRSEMLSTMEKIGIKTEKHHHEVASSGQAEINLAVAEALKMADQMVLYKYVVKNVAKRHGFSVTFMPKPVYKDNGTGMHTHQSLWKGGKNLFAGNGYGHMSDMAMNYIGGILNHMDALLAFTNPTTNSYKRLVPGFEAPIFKVYSARNRSAAVRIPIAVTGDKARRIEFRTPDASSCVYTAFAAMLMAGLDGVKKKSDPGKPADFDLYEATPEQKAQLKSIPHDLGRVLEALQADSAWATEGGVFTPDFLDSYVDYKMTNEVKEVGNMRPHPYEFVLYYDC